MDYIHYDQKSNGTIYASPYESFRDNAKVKTRRREVPPSALPSEPVVPETEKLILDFGDAWFLQEYLSKQPFYSSIPNTLSEESNTLFALIFYRLLANKGAKQAGIRR